MTSPSHHQEVHPLDALCSCCDPEKKIHYVYVGEKRGSYEQNTRGSFYYVGQHGGCYEQEELPPDHTNRCVCFCCIFVVFVCLLFYCVRTMPTELFDCMEGLENHDAGWSEMKKVYCCEEEGIACPGEDVTTPMPSMQPGGWAPAWLNEWMPEMSIGGKFIMSAIFFLFTGCCCGCAFVHLCLHYGAPEPHGKTEEELHSEVHTLCIRDGGCVDGEIVLTMCWDTTDELDMSLELPGGRGTINHNHPELCGGKMDINRNANGTKAKHPAVENIYWEPFCAYSSSNPPEGEYNLWIKVLHKRDPCKDTHVTIRREVAGKTLMYHRRICPGTRETHICEFEYKHARVLTDKEKELMRVIKTLQAEKDVHKHPLNVSMVWDTKDHINMQLRLPCGGGVRTMQEASDNSCFEPGSRQGQGYIIVPSPADGVYEIRAEVTDKKDDDWCTHITVVAHMNGKKVTFHRRIEGESSILVGVFTYKKP